MVSYRAGRIVLSGMIAVAVVGCGGSSSSKSKTQFQVVPLVSDQAGQAPHTDANLVNAWGIGLGAAGNFWISGNGSNKSVVYSGDVAGSPLTISTLVVDIPGGVPTGQVFNSTADFVVTSGAASGPALFIFASESGQITGWNPAVPPPAPSTTAQPGVTVPNAVYKGLAIANNGAANHLYAANFHAGTIDVFDATYTKVNLAGNFVDPGMPAGFNPFNVAVINGNLYVAYAKKEAAGDDDEPGAGNGYVDRFDLNGNFVGRLVSQGHLNSPWGMTIAPNSFGTFAGALLVGNFGDGWINAYNPTTGSYMGALTVNGSPLVIDGLWALTVGNGATSGDSSAVYFTAGPGGEQHGLFGKVVAN